MAGFVPFMLSAGKTALGTSLPISLENQQQQEQNAKPCFNNVFLSLSHKHLETLPHPVAGRLCVGVHARDG